MVTNENFTTIEQHEIVLDHFKWKSQRCESYIFERTSNEMLNLSDERWIIRSNEVSFRDKD